MNILWFKDCSYKNKNLVGGKNASLGELYHLSKKLAPDVIRYKYHNVFIPVGFEFDWCVNDCFDIGLRAEYRIDAYTRLKLSIPCIKVCEKLKLKRSQGVKEEMGIDLTAEHGELCF